MLSVVGKQFIRSNHSHCSMSLVTGTVTRLFSTVRPSPTFKPVGISSLLLKARSPRRSSQMTQCIRHLSKSNNNAGGTGSGPTPSRLRQRLKQFAKSAAIIVTGGIVASSVGLYYSWNSVAKEWFIVENATRVVKIDYNEVYKYIESIMNDSNYDDGSYGPVFIRLAWHASGTYDQATKTGGSSKATMRFDPEKSFDANKGLENARERLELVKQKFPVISYGDLWTLAGVVAVQEMGGPYIPWRPGRIDGKPEDCPPDGRLPDGANPSPQHPRDIFYRMGFTDQEIVALMGAHALGRCHKDRSGFEGPWTFSPTSFTHHFYVELLKNQWIVKPNWDGNKQFEDQDLHHIMMTPADMSFKLDPLFRQWCEIYAKDEKRFFCDFAKVFKKLLELGVEFPPNAKTYKFNRILE